jgi:hypothetical protein
VFFVGKKHIPKKNPALLQDFQISKSENYFSGVSFTLSDSGFAALVLIAADLQWSPSAFAADASAPGLAQHELVFAADTTFIEASDVVAAAAVEVAASALGLAQHEPTFASDEHFTFEPMSVAFTIGVAVSVVEVAV